MRKNFGTVLKEARESKHMTREELAKKVKVSGIYIAHLENENPAAPVSITLFEKIKQALNFEIGAARLAEKHNAMVRRYRNTRKKAA